MGPPRKIGKENSFFFRIFPATQKMGPEGPKWAGEDFFLLIQTLPTFWARTDFDFENVYFFLIFWDQQILAWARLGPGLGTAWALAWARAWARAWAPGFGARAWARLGPGRFGLGGGPSGGPGGPSGGPGAPRAGRVGRWASGVQH